MQQAVSWKFKTPSFRPLRVLGVLGVKFYYVLKLRWDKGLCLFRIRGKGCEEKIAGFKYNFLSAHFACSWRPLREVLKE
jgi:hypothetical protein